MTTAPMNAPLSLELGAIVLPDGGGVCVWAAGDNAATDLPRLLAEVGIPVRVLDPAADPGDPL